MEPKTQDIVTAIQYLLSLVRNARFAQTPEESSVMLKNLESIAQLAQALAAEPETTEDADVVED